MESMCNVHLVSAPFGVNGIECYDRVADPTNPGVLCHISRDKPMSAAGAARGVMQLSLMQQQNAGASTSDTESPLYIVSMHQKGRLLVWNADTLEVIGLCDHRGCSVVQCIMTQNYMYTRVEVSSDQDSEEDWKVYVWNIKTFDLVRQLASHEGRVTSVLVSDQSELCVATSSVDHSIHLWNLGQSTGGPVQKLSGLGNATLLLYFNGIILGGCTEAPFMAWDGETGAELFRAKIKENAGQVTTARWLKGNAPNGNYSARNRSHYRLITGDCDGIVREWVVDTSSKTDSRLFMSLKWARKIHRGPVTGLCGDSDVVLSYSLYDGAYLCLSKSGKVSPLVSYSVRSAILDTFSKTILIGVENGAINVMSYEHCMKEADEPVLIVTFRPQTTSITGLLLQLHADHTWDRLICSGADGAIAFLDYTKMRGSRWINGMGIQTLDFVPFCRSVLFSNTFGGITALNSIDMLPYNVQPQDPRHVTALRWAESMNTLIVGCENGMIFLYQITVDADQSPVFHKIDECKFAPYYPRNFSLSEPDGSLVLAMMQKKASIHDDAFLVLNANEKDLSGAPLAVQNICHTGGAIFTFSGSYAYNYTVILQLRDGSMLQYVGQKNANISPVMVRKLIDPLHSELLSMDASVPTNSLCNIIFFPTTSASGRLSLKIIYADGAMMKQLTFEALGDTPVGRVDFAKRDTSGGSTDTSNVLCLRKMSENIVVVRESPYVEIVSDSGDYLYRIAYSGDVMDHNMMGRRRRARSYPSEPVHLEGSVSFLHGPSACLAEFCEKRRYLAIGYSDGVVQLFDTSQKLIFMRFRTHTSMVAKIWVFPSMVISSTYDGVCHAGFVMRRVLFDVKESENVVRGEPIVLSSPMGRKSLSLSSATSP